MLGRKEEGLLATQQLSEKRLKGGPLEGK